MPEFVPYITVRVENERDTSMFEGQKPWAAVKLAEIPSDLQNESSNSPIYITTLGAKAFWQADHPSKESYQLS
jgi:hypothetical protein